MDQENIEKGREVGLTKKTKYIIIVIAVLLVGGFLVNGFMERKAGEKMAENILEKQFGGNVDIDSENGSVSVKSDKGNLSVGEMASWPSDMPNDVPEFTAGDLTMAASVSADGKGWQIAAVGVSKNDFDSYHSLLLSRGWADVGVFNSSIGMVQMNKGNYDLLIIFNPEDGALSLTVSVKQ